MKSYQLHLIRHGLTQGNLDGLYVGSGTDLPLCPEGEAALRDLKEKFVYPRVDTVFCSPLQRATQTADILFPEASHKMVVNDLREMAFGVYEGKKVLDGPHQRLHPQAGGVGQGVPRPLPHHPDASV